MSLSPLFILYEVLCIRDVCCLKVYLETKFAVLYNIMDYNLGGVS